ncbi:MAG: transporter [Gemmatimonadota bacterium]|nr:transporter [Gemmatimonadota bacterium]
MVPQPPEEKADLGFGRVVAQEARGRILSRNGAPRSHKYGLGAQRTERFYLRALDLPWQAFLGTLVGVLLLMNGIFALSYAALGPQALQGADALRLDDPFLRALSFSVGIFSTTGTGDVHAVGSTAHWLTVFESLLGPLTFIFAAGLLIARLTRPRMHLRFSDSAVIAPYRDGRALMFRVVNVLPGEVSDLQVRVNLVMFEGEGERRERKFHQLTLERDSVEFFPLHLTVVHPITPDSPLRGVTPDQLCERKAEVLVSMNAHEETFSTRVTARTSYLWDEVTWDAKFASIFASGPDGMLAIDVDRLDRMERLPEGSTSIPAAGE